MEPRESPYRKEDVCDQIPETLAGADLEVVGRHRSRYQKFTKNQDRLRGSVKPHEIIKKIVSPVNHHLHLPRGFFLQSVLSVKSLN